MSKTAIQVQNIGKRYSLGSQQRMNQTFREAIVAAFKAPLRRLKKTQRPQFWALKDVSFDINFGEVVGLIGRNGAGKSTLLKVLSRITFPTSGRVMLHGRVGSLLEVGTGFHPELSGRENIFMNGAILGMRHEEIKKKFEEIVEFAEISKFIDTPVKHYSSGMYLRLAFAVAAHLETEILLVDEVLAVGDMAFQRKCLNKMETVGQQGRAVVMVSHNMSAINRLCQRAILLSDGSIEADGTTAEITARYLQLGLTSSGERKWEHNEDAPSGQHARLRYVAVLDMNHKNTDVFDIQEPITFQMDYEIVNAGKRLSPGFMLYNEDGAIVFSSFDVSSEFVYGQDTDFIGMRSAICTIPGNLLAEGMYTMTVGITAILDSNSPEFWVSDALHFRIVDPMDGNSARGVYGGDFLGVVRPKLDWEHRVLVEQG